MKISTLLAGVLVLTALLTKAQSAGHQQNVFGSKPNTAGMMEASKLQRFMGNKTRISTTIKGKILAITKAKGGWFTIDAGSGKTISAHFKEYNITLPSRLKGSTVVIEGVAEKQFNADNQQHYAGNAGSEKKGKVKNAKSNQLTFEVTGMMAE